MFGGVATQGADRIVCATFDGTVVTFDAESGRAVAQYTLYPFTPEQVHVSACAGARDGTLLLCDARNQRVRRFHPDGRAAGCYGTPPVPGMTAQDDAAVFSEPCAVLALDDGFVVANGGLGMEHGVQRFSSDGRYVATIAAPEGAWDAAQGLAFFDDQLWVAETGTGRLRRFSLDGHHRADRTLSLELERPFRVAADGYGGLFLLCQDLDEEEVQATPVGLARLDAQGALEEWVVAAGEKSGETLSPFDVAVLPDGRFALADLPLGGPPEVRVQLYSPDGRLLRTLFDGSAELNAAQRAWFEEQDRGGDAYERARVRHYYGGTDAAPLAEAETLYRERLAAAPEDVRAHLHLASLLHRSLGEPAAAETAYRDAIATGGPESDLLARIADCRRELGDLDGAIALLQGAVESAVPPEEYAASVETLGSYYLERAGETPETMI